MGIQRKVAMVKAFHQMRPWRIGPPFLRSRRYRTIREQRNKRTQKEATVMVMMAQRGRNR